MLPTKECTYIVVGDNGASVLAWWIRHYFVDWLGNTPLEKTKVGGCVMGKCMKSWRIRIRGTTCSMSGRTLG